MLVEIVKGSDAVTPVRNRDTGEVRGFVQECYFHLPNSHFPVKGKIRVKDGSGFSVGKYNMEPNYQVGRFGDLEINPFEPPLMTVATPEQVKAVS